MLEANEKFFLESESPTINKMLDEALINILRCI